jgi:hypothetical protein
MNQRPRVDDTNRQLHFPQPERAFQAEAGPLGFVRFVSIVKKQQEVAEAYNELENDKEKETEVGFGLIGVDGWRCTKR